MGRPSKKRHVEEEQASSDAEVSQPTKKTKTQSAKEGNSGTDYEGNSFWSLSATRRVVIQPYNGKTYINIREYYDHKGELKPAKKGIMLPLDQYNALLSAIPDVNAKLISQGHEITDVALGNSKPSAPEKSADSASKDKKQKKKSNIEATSDEEESE